MKKRLIMPMLLIFALLWTCSLSACGGYGRASQSARESGSDASAYGNTYYAETEEEVLWDDSAPLAMGETAEFKSSTGASSDGSIGTGTEAVSDGPQLEEKLVYSGSLTVQTLEYDDCVAAVRRKVTEFGGIIQSESESDNDHTWYYDDHVNTSTRNLYMVIRIPSAQFYSFLSSVSEDGKVISKSVNVENISQSYSDTKTQIEALEIEEKRLLEMMEKAETIEDMIAVESRLTEVQSDLNFYKTRLRGMDTDVAWSTISLSIDEVKKYSPAVEEQTFGDRVKEAFADAWSAFTGFLQDLVIILIELLPFLLLLLVIVLIVLFIVKKTAPRREARRLEKEVENVRKQAEREARRQEAMMQQRGRMPMPPYGQGYAPAGVPADPDMTQPPAPGLGSPVPAAADEPAPAAADEPAPAAAGEPAPEAVDASVPEAGEGDGPEEGDRPLP